MAGLGFDDLLQQAEQLTTTLDGGTELPRVQRNFQQLLDAGQRLCSKSNFGQDDAQIKASLLLSAQGKDVPKVSDRLKSLTPAQSFEPLETVCDTDIESFLKNERENAILAVVEEQKQKTYAEVEKRHWQTRLNAWEKEKQQILNKLIGNDGTMNFSQELTEQMSVSYYRSSVDTTSNPGSNMDSWELAYARQVHMYNDRIIEGGLPLNLSELCKNAAEKMKDKNLFSVWKMVNYLTDVAAGVGQFPSILAQRTSKSVLVAFIAQARKFLEDNYVEYMLNTVYARPHIAQRGGVPGTLNLVKSFLKVQPTHNLMQGYDDGEIDGIPLWAVIFYCLRCGDLDAAVDVAKQNEHIIPEFYTWIQEYAHNNGRKLSSASANKMKIQYKRSVSGSADPYKIAVYCIIGHCDVTDVHTEVAKRAEDYLWIKLSQVEVTDKPYADDLLTLYRLQTLLVDEYGESHFNAASNPLLYFQILMLTCQFEQAIEFLSRFEALRCHAVHIALALNVQEFLLTPLSLHAKMLTCDPVDNSACTIIKKLNLCRLIMMYTRKFELTDPREALNYFYFLRNVKSEGQSLLAHCTSELVRETGEFEMLLGKLNPDGSRKPGVIDKYCSKDKEQLRKLISKVAADTEAKGLHEDAVHLHDLCGNHDQTLTLLNRLLSMVISSSDDSHPDRSRLKHLSLSIAERYRNHSVETSQLLRSTFHLLLDLVSFFDLYHANRVEQALDVMRELQILPSSTEQVHSKVTAFKLYSDDIRQNIANILLATMNLLVRQCKVQQNLNKSVVTKTGDSVFVNARQYARALITFAGMLPYHLPGDATARLVQLEVQLN
ncbi:nuclear pore complex protein Nup93-like [Clavelina lepadiformis]|uniref:nuclear pore complex protein Nup93-like n=1 Tax=Clavelina lepadiformis TaxID=159417 RepID=UPI004041DE1A